MAPQEAEVAEVASPIAVSDSEDGEVGVGNMDDGRGGLFSLQGVVCGDGLKLEKDI